jgi:outer membrane biosynthesis protein TonB
VREKLLLNFQFTETTLTRNNVGTLWLTLLLTHCSKLPCFTLVIVELLVCLVGSLHRKKELELWLKDREAKRKAEDKEKRKPFYVGSRNAVASTNPFSVTGHTCCHGTRTTLPSNATQTQDPPMAKKVKPKTKPVLKEPSQPSRRPQTRSQTAKPKKDTNVSRNTRTRTTSNAATATVTKSSRGTGTQGATVTKTTRSTGTQGTTVTKHHCHQAPLSPSPHVAQAHRAPLSPSPHVAQSHRASLSPSPRANNISQPSPGDLLCQRDLTKAHSRKIHQL